MRILMLCFLAACSAPSLDVPGEAEAARTRTPRLVPIERFYDPSAEDRITQQVTDDTRGRADALRARPRAQTGTDDLSDRAARLRTAAGQTAGGVSDADRARLRAARERLSDAARP